MFSYVIHTLCSVCVRQCRCGRKKKKPLEPSCLASGFCQVSGNLEGLELEKDIILPTPGIELYEVH